MTSDDAAADARRTLGNVSLAREDARAIWIGPKAESVWQDFKYALRSLVRQPGFTVVAAGTLAVAIGLNTSLFTAYSALAWRQWPVPESERVVNIGSGIGAGGFSHAAFRYLTEHATRFDGVFAERRAGMYLLGDGRMRALGQRGLLPHAARADDARS